MTDHRNDERAEDEPAPDQPGQPEDAGHHDDDYEDEDEEDEPEPEEHSYGPYTSEDFHNVTHKLVAHAVDQTLRNSKLDWELVAPFLESAREMAHADFQEADVRIHTVRRDGQRDGVDVYVEADEAYIGFSVADRDSGEEWLTATFWLSELAIEEDRPEQVRRIIAAVERSVERMREWLAEKEAGDAGNPTPPAEGNPS